MKTSSLTVDPASPLVINNQNDRLPDGRVGMSYDTGLFPAGGAALPVVARGRGPATGSVRPGVFRSVRGTPTAAGTFTFTVRVDDSAASSATGRFTITMTP